MFFLLRLAFWLGLVLILLPTGAGHRAATANRVDAAEAVSAASATVHDVEGFCTREPKACTVGSQVAAIMAERARAGARMLYNFLTEAMAPRGPGTASRGETSPGKATAAPRSQDTLTPADLAPAWRGPPPRRSVARPQSGDLRRASFKRASGRRRPDADGPGA